MVQTTLMILPMKTRQVDTGVERRISHPPDSISAAISDAPRLGPTKSNNDICINTKGPAMCSTPQLTVLVAVSTVSSNEIMAHTDTNRISQCNRPNFRVWNSLTMIGFSQNGIPGLR